MYEYSIVYKNVGLGEERKRWEYRSEFNADLCGWQSEYDQEYNKYSEYKYKYSEYKYSEYNKIQYTIHLYSTMLHSIVYNVTVIQYTVIIVYNITLNRFS